MTDHIQEMINSGLMAKCFEKNLSGSETEKLLLRATESIIIAIRRTKNKDGLLEMKRLDADKVFDEVTNLYNKLYKLAE